MLKKPLVSIVIPVYNQEDYVEKSIISITSQTYSNIEIIISDDCSTDNSPEILKELAKSDSRIRLFLQKNNLGITDNYNFLTNHISGKYVALFSGDDIMMKNKIERQVKALENDSKASFCHHAVQVIDMKTEKDLYTIINKYSQNITTAVDIIRDMGVSGSMSLLCRQTFLDDPVFNPTIRVASDWLQMIEMAEKSYAIYLPEVLCYYRKDNTYNGKDPTKYEDDFIKTFSIVESKYSSSNPDMKEALIVSKNRYLLGSSFRQLQIGNKLKAKSLLMSRSFNKRWNLIPVILFLLCIIPIPNIILIRLKSYYKKYYEN